MYIDLLPDNMAEDDGTARVSCFLDESFDVEEIKSKVKAELDRLSEYISVGTGIITESETKEEDWRDNWKAYFKPFRLYDNIIIKPTWEELPSDATGSDIVIEIDPGAEDLSLPPVRPLVNDRLPRDNQIVHRSA